MKSSTWHRRAAALVGLAAASSVITLLVAWGCAMFSPVRDTSTHYANVFGEYRARSFGYTEEATGFWGETVVDPGQEDGNGAVVLMRWVMERGTIAAGWPCRALEAPYERKGDRPVPTTPIVSGFVVNTALAMAASLVLLGMPGFARRRVRRSRGRCLGCGYDMRGSDLQCAECGATRDLDSS